MTWWVELITDVLLTVCVILSVGSIVAVLIAVWVSALG